MRHRETNSRKIRSYYDFIASHLCSEIPYICYKGVINITQCHSVASTETRGKVSLSISLTSCIQINTMFIYTYSPRGHLAVTNLIFFQVKIIGHILYGLDH